MSFSYTTPSQIASRIISELHIIDPSQIDLEAIAADRKAYIREQPINGSAARLVRKGSIGLITVDSNIKEPGKKRFAAAHELGHFELHRAQEQFSICTDESFLEWYSQTPKEPEANTFAAELLMPTEIFKKYCQETAPNYEEISLIAEKFKTTLTATSIRYVDVGPHACVLFASKDGIIKWFHPQPNFPYQVVKPGTKLSKFSCANDFFTDGTVPERPEDVRGDAWLEDFRAGVNIILYEHARALPRYNMVLSLLWLREDLNLRYR